MTLSTRLPTVNFLMSSGEPGNEAMKFQVISLVSVISMAASVKFHLNLTVASIYFDT